MTDLEPIIFSLATVCFLYPLCALCGKKTNEINSFDLHTQHRKDDLALNRSHCFENQKPY